MTRYLTLNEVLELYRQVMIGNTAKLAIVTLSGLVP